MHLPNRSPSGRRLFAFGVHEVFVRGPRLLNRIPLVAPYSGADPVFRHCALHYLLHLHSRMCLAAALVRGLGGQMRQARVENLAGGVYTATVEVEGPFGAQSVDARPSDALNLAAITKARVFVRLDLIDDFERLQPDDSAESGLLRLARTIPNMKITRAD